ncbi:MAG TPA: aldo/keto reductase, partial [Chitinophagaceae bacterium]|nr:aldo/keto reductase [Chitinophagaceae bacterium]
MEYNALGRSGLEISRIGFGAMSLRMGEDANANLLNEAIALGINFFDTADLYDKGMNEEAIGKALKEKRDKVIIATKVGNQWRPDGSGWDWNPSKDYILSCIEKSLKR